MAWTKQGNIKGTRGTIWFSGAGAPGTQGVTMSPSGATPQAGDFYLDTTTGDIYQF